MTKEGHKHKIDDLGRVLLPRELRKDVGWDIGDILYLHRMGDTLVLSLEEKGVSNPDSVSEGS